MSQVESQQCLANFHASTHENYGFKPAFQTKSLVAMVLILAACIGLAPVLLGDDIMGFTALRQKYPSITGTGIPVAQVEAGFPAFEVDPSIVGQPASLFVYFNTNGTAVTGFPNSVGSVSDHANGVAGIFYGLPSGFASGVVRVDNYEASSFFNHFISGSISIPTRIVNQSFIFTSLSATDQLLVESDYDDYAATFNVLFLSGMGNGGPVSAPGTAYNSIGVAAYGGASSVGPNSDGRSKPDITAPAGATSFSTPLVSGAATLLLQAANQDIGGSGTSASASDIRTLKSLLLGGAIKPRDWTHGSSAPLDTRYGAGVLNVFNSYTILAAGKHSFVESTVVTTGSSHPAGTNPGNVTSNVGWDFNSISGTSVQDKVNHYYLNVTNQNGSFTACLNWNRQVNQPKINDLDLFLYDVATGNLVASSISTIDNVELIYLAALSKGRYDLQVVKNGLTKRVTSAESYALTYQVTETSLAISKNDFGSPVAAWPLFPNGFVLESKPSLDAAWSPVPDPASVVNNSYQLTLSPTQTSAFYRLRLP
ncbi:MAG: hypothetical protein JWM04_1972 [Verrucomicrobiales bacterium]|nr:hypothetical protein [Verrucomicrobiales bacterium]